jgi:hypothetical protein
MQCHIRGLWADLARVVMSRKGGSTFFPFPAFFRCCRAPGQCSKKGVFLNIPALRQVLWLGALNKRQDFR